MIVIASRETLGIYKVCTYQHTVLEPVQERRSIMVRGGDRRQVDRQAPDVFTSLLSLLFSTTTALSLVELWVDNELSTSIIHEATKFSSTVRVAMAKQTCLAYPFDFS